MPAFRRLMFAGVAVLATALWSAGPVGAGGSDWKVGYYTPSGRALSTASADLPNAGLADFNFTDQTNTALLVTTHGSSPYLGDLTGKTVSATFTISGVTGQFIYFGEPSCGNTISTTRLFFTTSNAGGFDETHYWWSNPVHYNLNDATSGPVTVTLTESVGNPAAWSDFFGHSGDNPTYADGFANAASNVTTIGLSFGGGCFFENGVGTSDGSGTFTLDSFSVS